MTEGLHFRVPWFQYPVVYDIRARPRKITSPTGSKDLQMVNISLRYENAYEKEDKDDDAEDLQMSNMLLRVLSRPDSSNLPALHKELGQDFDEKVRCYRRSNWSQLDPAGSSIYLQRGPESCCCQV